MAKGAASPSSRKRNWCSPARRLTPHSTYVLHFEAVPDAPLCPRCLEFEEEVRDLRQRLAAVGQHVTYTPGPSVALNVEQELQRWLAVNQRADAAAGFRAGWARLARFVQPRFREWEARWFRAM